MLLLGFILLIKGADYFVDGAASIAYKFHISTTIVGLTIVALGTSLPEFAVSVSASLAGSNALAISNVVGSNIFNTLVVVGTSAMIAPFVISKDVINRDLGFNIFCSLLLLLFLVMNLSLDRWEGFVFIALLVCYILYLVRDAKKHPIEDTEEEEKKILPTWKSILFCVLGAAAIMVGGDFTVDSAKEIAAYWGMSETLIGLTIVSVGTSLPELVTSVVAARKGESGLSIGNAIGSSILNILFILGTSSAIHPLTATWVNVNDVIFLCIVAVGIFCMAKISNKMDRWKGFVLLLIYVLYLAYIIFRQ